MLENFTASVIQGELRLLVMSWLWQVLILLSNMSSKHNLDSNLGRISVKFRKDLIQILVEFEL